MIHVVLILLGIIMLDIIPGITSDLSWTIVNLSYLIVRLVVLKPWRLPVLTFTIVR